MSPLIITLIVIGIILLLLLLFYIGMLNSLRQMEVKVEEALSGIDVALTKRYDTITKMLETTKGYAKHESETLMKIVEARKGSISNLPLGEKQELLEELNGVQTGISVIVEQYPELKADTTFSNLQKSIVDVEEHLQAARRLYNSNVRILNQRIVTIPYNFVANGKGITKKDFFVADNIKREDVEINF